MQGTVEVTLNLRETTLRKLRSLAMLTGTTVSDIEAKLSDLFDEMLTDSIQDHLHEMDGTTPPADTTYHLTVAAPAPTPRSFASAVQQAAAAPSDETEEAPLTDHSLSSEEAEEGKSLEEQIQEEVKASAAPPQVPAGRKIVVEQMGDIPANVLQAYKHGQDVGDNGDAFLDAAMAPEKKPQRQNGRVAARTAFDPRSPRVTIKNTSENESAGDDLGFMS